MTIHTNNSIAAVAILILLSVVSFRALAAENVSAALPDLSVAQASGEDLISRSDDSVDFGAVGTDGSASQTFTIKNSGKGDLTNGGGCSCKGTSLGFTINGENGDDFSVTAKPAGSIIPGASATFTVIFKPGDAGARNAVLQIISNDPQNNPFEIALSGTGVTPARDVTITRGEGRGARGEGREARAGKRFNITPGAPLQNAGVTDVSPAHVASINVTQNGSTPMDKTVTAREQASAAISAETISQIVALVSEKESRTPAQRKLDSHVLQDVREAKGQAMAAGTHLNAAKIGLTDGGLIKVDIDARVSDALIAKLENLGGQIIFPSSQYSTIRANVPLTSIETIAGYDEVTFIKPAVRALYSGPEHPSAVATTQAPRPKPQPALEERLKRVRERLSKALRLGGASMTGSVTSQGDRTHRADDARNTYGYEGQGVRIGVLSDSFNALGGASADVLSGDLPGPGNPLGNMTPVKVLADISSGADEGRAMLQIVHDLAPKATLFFATADISEASFATNIQALRNAPNNCDIIIDDVFYLDEPVFQDGIVAKAVNTVTASGALYFSSAGNEGSKAKGTAGYFEGDFNDAGSPAFIFPGGTKVGTIHNFGTIVSPVNGDIILSAGEAYTLNWADPAGASHNDYDFFLVNSTGTVIDSSTNFQTGGQSPFEFIQSQSLSAGDRLVVFKSASAAPVAFGINTLRGTLTVSTTGQTHGHSAAVNAFSVAAAPAAGAFDGAAPVGPFPGAYTAAQNVESFTSDGPRRVFFNPDGTPITAGNFLFGTNGGNVRNKPDITAADGVVTTLPSGSPLNPFYGTSAAAPHAGAIAGLLKSANPSLTPAQIRAILTSTALDIEGAGYDNISGFGIVQAFQAMQAVSPSPLSNIDIGTVTATEGSFSNFNGVIDPGELGNLVVQLKNTSLASAPNVVATLSTTTSGVTIVQGSASYGTLASLSNGSNAGAPFVFGVNSSVTCGTVIDFSLSVSFGGGGPSPQVFFFSQAVGSQFAAFNGMFGSAPPTAKGVSSTSGQQTDRISRNGAMSSCAAPKSNPGLIGDGNPRQFDAYTFTNTNAVDQCVTVTLSAANGNNLYSVTYGSAGFVPANPSINFLADAGSSSINQTYSFIALAGQSFTTVVHDINVLPASGSNYSLTVSLAACSAGPACSPVIITTASIPSGATGAAYSASFSATGGSGGYEFTTASGLPAGLSFSGNTLSGTPTQAGSFPITVNAIDAAGCPSGSKNFTLVIAGTVAASITATAGDGQTVPPTRSFPTALQAAVKDGSNNPLPGVNVVFTAPSSGASGTFDGGGTTVTILTDASGLATAPIFTANATTGSYVVTASVSGVVIPAANFYLSNTCSPTFVVTSNADMGPGTLRDALSLPCPGTIITFDPSVTNIALTSGELAITQAITINGPGANLLTLDGSQLNRIFNINAGAASVSISGMTLTNGVPFSGSAGGGAILIDNGAAAGAVNITACTLSNNDASAAGNPLGGAIDNEGGTVTIDRCAIVNNTASFRSGGIQNQGFGSMTIINSTIAGNTAGGTGVGGGIRNLLPLILTNCTIFGNSAQTGGNISNSGGTITFANTIIAGGVLIGAGSGPDISGTGFVSADYNLIQNTSAGTITGTTTHNINGVSPNLNPLGDYGGPTPSLLPMSGSPVIDAGPITPAEASDQRGLPRLFGAATDIGSVEVGPAISITADAASKLEGTGGTTPFTFTVARTLGTAGAATVNYAVTGSGANPASAADFGGTLPSGTVTIPDTQASVKLTINVTGDSLVEPDEEFTVTLSKPPAGTIVFPATAKSIILDDDVAAAPAATTTPASPIGATSATLNGIVNDKSASTIVSFEFGTTTAYGTIVAGTPSPLTSGIDTGVSGTATNLLPNTLYHFRVNAVNSLGTTHGADVTFTTLSPPVMLSVSVTALPDAATPITNSPVTFSAVVTPAEAVVTWDFGDGTAAASGAVVRHFFSVAGTYTVTATAGSGAGTVSATLAVVVADGTDGLLLVRGTIRTRPTGDTLLLYGVVKLDPAQFNSTSSVVIGVDNLSRTFTFSKPGALISADGRLRLQFFKFLSNGVPQARFNLHVAGQLKNELFAGLPLDANGNPTQENVRVELNGKTYAVSMKTQNTFHARGSTIQFGYRAGR